MSKITLVSKSRYILRGWAFTRTLFYLLPSSVSYASSLVFFHCTTTYPVTKFVLEVLTLSCAPSATILGTDPVIIGTCLKRAFIQGLPIYLTMLQPFSLLSSCPFGLFCFWKCGNATLRKLLIGGI